MVPVAVCAAISFQSILSVWRVTKHFTAYKVAIDISIHTLRVESNLYREYHFFRGSKFQSILSVWRVTVYQSSARLTSKISIHTLRVESNIHTLRVESNNIWCVVFGLRFLFQSILSVWRVTIISTPLPISSKFQSILSVWRVTLCNRHNGKLH